MLFRFVSTINKTIVSNEKWKQQNKTIAGNETDGNCVWPAYELLCIVMHTHTHTYCCLFCFVVFLAQFFKQCTIVVLCAVSHEHHEQLGKMVNQICYVCYVWDGLRSNCTHCSYFVWNIGDSWRHRCYIEYILVCIDKLPPKYEMDQNINNLTAFQIQESIRNGIDEILIHHRVHLTWNRQYSRRKDEKWMLRGDIDGHIEINTCCVCVFYCFDANKRIEIETTDMLHRLTQ